MPDIVQIVEKRLWDVKLDRSRWLSVKPIVSRITGPGWPDWIESDSAENNLNHIHGRVPDVVIGYKTHHINGMRSLPCLRVSQYNEIKPLRFLDELREYNAIVFHHAIDMSYWKSTLKRMGIKACHIPHVADKSIFHPSGVDRQFDVIFIGDTCDNVYPLRRMFSDVQEQLAGRYRVFRPDHPGYEPSNASGCRHMMDFAGWIGRSKIACFCSSIFKYRLAKYIEVPACGTLVAADLPIVEAEDRMSDYVIQCDLADGVSGIVDKLRCAINSFSEDDAIDYGLSYASRYTPESYCKRFLDFVKQLK